MVALLCKGHCRFLKKTNQFMIINNDHIPKFITQPITEKTQEQDINVLFGKTCTCSMNSTMKWKVGKCKSQNESEITEETKLWVFHIHIHCLVTLWRRSGVHISTASANFSFSTILCQSSLKRGHLSIKLILIGNKLFSFHAHPQMCFHQ